MGEWTRRVATAHLLVGSLIELSLFIGAACRSDERSGIVKIAVTNKKIEMYCKDEIVEEVIETIRKTVHTGSPDDGKIYALGVVDALRISTGERGEEAC